MAHKRRTQRRFSPVQLIKGFIIKLRLARRTKERDGKMVFELLWARIGALMLAFMFFGWLSLAAGAYFFVKHAREFPDVRYTDLVLPSRWDNYRQARGDYYIALAKEKMERGDYSKVVHLIRVGVQQSPDNSDGRLILASIYNSIGRPDQGIALLREKAMSHTGDKEYISALITLLFANHEDKAVDELATKILANNREITDLTLIVALAGATANFNRGNYERAQEFIDDFQLIKSRTGTILQARIDWEQGRQTDAIALLEKVAFASGNQRENALGFLTEYLFLSGQKDRALQISLMRSLGDPLNFHPRIRLLSVYDLLGNDAKRDEEIEDYLGYFAREEEAIQALADLAGRTNNVALAERVVEHTRTHEMAGENPALRLIQARIGARDYSGAIDTYLRIEKETREWTPLQRGRLHPLLASAYLGIGNTERGDILLKEVLTLKTISPNDVMQLAHGLIQNGDFTRAREVLQHIYNSQPLNQEALGRLIRLDIQTGNNRELVRNVNRLLKTRKPPAVVLQEAHRHISSDLFLFEQNRGEILGSLESMLLNSTVRGS